MVRNIKSLALFRYELWIIQYNHHSLIIHIFAINYETKSSIARFIDNVADSDLLATECESVPTVSFIKTVPDDIGGLFITGHYNQSSMISYFINVRPFHNFFPWSSSISTQIGIHISSSPWQILACISSSYYHSCCFLSRVEWPINIATSNCVEMQRTVSADITIYLIPFAINFRWFY